MSAYQPPESGRTDELPLALRSGQETVTHPQTEGLTSLLGGSETQGVLGVGQSGRDHLAPGVLGGRASGTRVHAATIASTGSLDQRDLREYGKCMTNTEIRQTVVRTATGRTTHRPVETQGANVLTGCGLLLTAPTATVAAFPTCNRCARRI